MGWASIRTVELLRGQLVTKGLHPTERSIREHFYTPSSANRAVARRQLAHILRHLQRQGTEFVVLDPVYSDHTIRAVEEGVRCQYYTIGILASFATRRRRLATIGRQSGLSLQDEWMHQQGVRDTLLSADYVITNTRGMGWIRRAVERVLSTIADHPR